MEQETPYRKILIANRGEIALRILRTAHAMGYQTVAVHSDADRDAAHVREAGEAVHVGPAAPTESYLRVDRILEAARLSGADAVHPGYGFLAENAEFVRACKEQGLAFIGPPAEAIEAMGDKAASKRLMESAGVPCVPGYQGEDQGHETLQAEAERIGFPIMIKATAGGGGRGMRLVQDATGFADALQSAQSEAAAAFGNAEVILERAVLAPRHIEIQVMADRAGNVIHLGERDCSVQRRHQKIIEEAPSPAVTPELRERMGATAIEATRAIGYEGAGTLEFLVDQDGNYYFMEMNTRLQVEHPVTECLTGLDLVELQLRCAAGERLPLTQDDVRFDGHAIEVRLCAESPATGFMPQSGTMSLWRMPESIRVDHALVSGEVVSPYYDSMLAKLISHGHSRDDARRRLGVALEETVALGVETNQAFLRDCLEHPVFAAGDATTSFVEEYGDAVLEAGAGDQERMQSLAAALLYVVRAESGPASGALTRRNLPALMRFDLQGETVAVEVVENGTQGLTLIAEEGDHRFRLVQLDGSNARFELDGLRESVTFVQNDGRLYVRYRGRSYTVVDRTYNAVARHDDGAQDGTIRASMNGRVVSIQVEEGDRVQAGDPILTLEAMKMEHVHVAPLDGEVTRLDAAVGDQIAASRVIAEVEPAEGAGES